MPLLAAYRGSTRRAPENTGAALLAAYTSGASVLEFDAQPTGDGQLVVASPTALADLTDQSGAISEMSLAALRQVDFAARFHAGDSAATPWKKTPPLARIETLGAMLDLLPSTVTIVIQAFAADAGRTDELVAKIADTIARRGIQRRVVLCSTDMNFLRAARSKDALLSLALVCQSEIKPDDWQAIVECNLSGLVLPLSRLLDDANQTTALCTQIARWYQERGAAHGVFVRTQTDGGVFNFAQYQTLSALSFVYSISVAAIPEMAALIKQYRTLGDASFAGTVEDAGRFHFGYAKANRYAHVFQADGVHIKIAPYQELPTIRAVPVGDPVQDKLDDLQGQMWDAARNWPFYSGGGFGTAFGIEGDFIAEVDFQMEVTSQATMCEMAATNVDPARHRTGWKIDDAGQIITGADGQPLPNVPESFRDKDSFFDPHGAPPFVGVEHDEDDGYRINYNLGTEYDNNQYGRPHGSGETKTGRFRLERRGPYFSAFYQDEENHDWVCCGVCRNDSMNERVFIRCAGKRWRQESDPTTPGQFFPIPHNHIIFRNFTVRAACET